MTDHQLREYAEQHAEVQFRDGTTIRGWLIIGQPESTHPRAPYSIVIREAGATEGYSWVDIPGASDVLQIKVIS